MKIDTSKIVFDAEISDELFFWLMSTNENGPAAECEYSHEFFFDTFAWSKHNQLLMLEAIHSGPAQDEYEKLCDEFNKVKKTVGYIRIKPEHPGYEWDDVITYDTMSWETWKGQQKNDA